MNQRHWLYTFFTILVFSISAHTQRYNDCIYWSIEDFAENLCDDSESPYVDKVVGKKNPVKRYLVKTDLKNKKLRKAFAVKIDGEMYFDQYQITRYLSKGDNLTSPGTDSYYIKVVSQGTYEYLEWTDGGGSGPGVGIGSGAFGTGVGLGTSLSLGKKKIKGIIYDPQRFEFNVFKNCKDFNEFLAERHPELAYECKKKKLPIEKVREVMSKLNKGIKRENGPDGKPVRFVTVYPHRSIVRNGVNLTIENEIIELSDVSVIDIDLDCGGDNNICIEGTETCIDVPCESEIEYVIVSRNKETKEYMIEASNEKDFEYYNRIIERRKERNKKR